MRYVNNVLESINLKVELPMILEINIQCEVDRAKRRVCSGGTKYTQVRELWLSELHENFVIKVMWSSSYPRHY